MRIRAKIFIYIIITSSIIFAGVIGFIIFRYREYSINEANRLANVYAKSASDKIKSALEKDLTVCETISQSFIGLYNMPVVSREKLFNEILVNVHKAHPEYLSVWMSWELRFLQAGYAYNYGRKRTVTLLDAGFVKTIIDTANVDGDDLGSDYYQSKISQKDMLVNPYYYKYNRETNADSILETSIAKPLVINGEFAGIVGIDITLERFQKMVDEIRPFENSSGLMISNNGFIISALNKAKSNDSLLAIFPDFAKFDVINKVKKGDEFSFNYSDSSGTSNHVIFTPIKVGNSETPWSICIITPTTIIEEKVIRNFNTSIIIGLFGILSFSILTLFIVQRIVSPLQQSTAILKDLDKGIIDFSKKLKPRSHDELGEMSRSINNLMDTLYVTADFAKKIGQGDFNVSYETRSELDVLGNALIDMQNNLRIGQEQEEIRQLERVKYNWAQEGLSELGEVLRNSGDNFEDYLFNILSLIVKILKADQGAIFLLNTNDKDKPYLELMTAYAYEKRKSLQAHILIGESLVGRCFQEKEFIYMTNIPEGYTFISSGLGGESPRALFLMPLLFEDEPFGVIELASFRQFADFEIEFLKSSGERVASSISIMQKNVQTKELLHQYQVQSDELRLREQMMQESLEELQKLQGEADKREKETTGIIDALADIGSIVWYDLNGKILNIKDKNLKLAGLTESKIIGRKHSEFANELIEDPEGYRQFWIDLRNGIPRRRLFKTATKDGFLYISELYTPIKNKDGVPDKIINIGFNVTEQKLLEEEIELLKAEILSFKKNQG